MNLNTKLKTEVMAHGGGSIVSRALSLHILQVDCHFQSKVPLD